jgi:hypothetical protein
MCEPATIAAVTVLASTAFVAHTQAEQGRYQKKVSKYNARVAENQAQEVRRAGTEEENALRRKTANLLSKQRAQLGAAGVVLGSGSALQLQEDTVAMGEADALRIRREAGLGVSALETSAELTLSQGEAAQQLGTTRAVGTLLGGASTAMGTGVADKWFTPSSSANASNATPLVEA